MHHTEWDIIDEIVYCPEVVKLGILVILQKSCSHNKPIHDLELFINSLVYERKKIIISELGLFISSSIFIPYDILPETILGAMQDLIASNTSRSVFKKNDIVHICFDSPTHLTQTALGVINVICGLLLAINQADKLKIHSKSIDHKICIFDVILKSIFFKHRVDYALVLRSCVRFGYCAAAIEASEPLDVP